MTSALILCVMLATLTPSHASGIQQQQDPLYPFRSSVFLQDDFTTGSTTSGLIGALGWGASVAVTVPGGGTNPGVISLATGAVSGTVARLNSLGSQPYFASLNIASLFRVALQTNDANTTVRVGITDNFTVNPPNNGIYFEKLDADTNWFCVTRSGAVQTRVDSGVAITTSFTNLAHSRNSSGVTFKIDQATVCGLMSTNVPTSGVGQGIHIINSAAASKDIQVDYAELAITGLNR